MARRAPPTKRGTPSKAGPASVATANGFRSAGRRSALRPLEVGLLVPTSGAAATWGPSRRASATLAARETNQAGGMLGREVVLRIEAAGGDPVSIVERPARLQARGAIDAVVGKHISAVREAMGRAVGRRIPYICTPLCEGGERTPGVFAIGETPADQLLPALGALSTRIKRHQPLA